MKRSALLYMGLALGTAGTAEAQLTMQMGNGWNFTFSGNAHAFFTYENPEEGGGTVSPGTLAPAGGDGASRIRTGLLPAFAVFDAKGREGNTDIGVHFGFAPEVQCAAAVHDCFGAQIDMRQVYMTVGGSWGQLLVGRELGLFGRQNILTDQTLFGVGGTGGSAPGTGAGTTLGRIGLGYIYPQFKAQMTYSTATGRPLQLSVGLFEAAANGPYITNELPRIEAEAVWSQSNTKLWLGGLLQNTSTPSPADESVTAWGTSGGVRWGGTQFSITGSGYYGMGLGTTFLFNGLGVTPTGAPGGAVGGTGGSDDLRTSYGFIGQLTFTPAASKMTFAGSYGSSFLEAADNEADFKTENTLASGGLYYQATKSLKIVGEANYYFSKDDDDATETNKSFAPAFGLMVFF
jgi:hypothetical protein